MDRSFVDYASGEVTCTRDAWTCQGSVASLQLVREGTPADRECSRAEGDVNSVSRALGTEDVHYEFSFECHVPAWTAVDTVGIPGNRIDHSFLEPNISAVSPRNGAVRGGDLLTVYGSYFSVRDSRPVIQIGSTDCETSTWVSDSVVTCVTGVGWDSGHRVAWHSEGSQDAVRTPSALRPPPSTPDTLHPPPSTLNPQP